MPQEQTANLLPKLIPRLDEALVLAAPPIQDAINLARVLVETTIGFMRYVVTRAKTVGGPIEIAVITKHEGFKWVQRKHFFSGEFNPPA